MAKNLIYIPFDKLARWHQNWWGIGSIKRIRTEKKLSVTLKKFKLTWFCFFGRGEQKKSDAKSRGYFLPCIKDSIQTKKYTVKPELTITSKKVQVNTPFCIWIWLFSLSLMFVTDNFLDEMIVSKSKCLQIHARQIIFSNGVLKMEEIELKWVVTTFAHLSITTKILRSLLNF
jgi:hypothetical protein